MLNNIFSYTQVVIAFVLQEDFDIWLGPFLAFCLFLLQKNFDVFHVLLSPVFLCVFDDIYLLFLYIWSKFLRKIFSISFIRIFFARIFFIRVFSLEFSLSEFSWSESEETSISSIIYLEIFFSLRRYFYSSKNTWG